MQKILAFNIRSVFINSTYAITGKVLAGLLMLFCVSFSLSAQEKTKIILLSSERSRIITKTDITYLRKPVFKQDNAILTCDSAVFYTAKNYFEAFKNVHINQADTINIYSDFLTYDGNSKLAHLTSNVRLVDKSSVLTTNILDYNMVPKVGTYVEGGKIVNKDATITSKNGYYFANSRDAYFRFNVNVVTEQSTIKSDTLRYNTFSNWAYFYGPTNIKEKDGGNLYTENGAYNTSTRYAYFGKKNLYTSGSRSMKGDSLYYDGIAGYGRAVRNITFRDTVDKMLMRGQLGYYYKADQRTVVTKNAYAGLGTEDSVMVNNVKQPDSLWLGADTLETQMALQNSLKLLKGPVISKDNEIVDEDRESKMNGVTKNADTNAENQTPVKKQPPTVKKPADPSNKKDTAKVPLPLANDSLKKDSLKTDSLKLPPGLKKAGTELKDSLPPKKTDSIIKPVLPLTKKDSLPPVNPLDTVRTRSIKAYRNVNVYKSNMQAKADSLFYTSADSTLRWYRNPIIWAQGSQQTGDTIYLQLRNKKINSVQVIHNAFAVNVDPIDTTKFNQIKGKLITGFFNDGKLSSMYVDGNSESIYFTKSDDGTKYDKMNQTVSSRIKIVFRNNEIGDVVPIKNVEGATTPVSDLKGDMLLTGFIWKPDLRPRSKKDVTNPRVHASPKKVAAVKKGVTQLKDTVTAKVKAAEPLKNADQLKSAAQAKGAALLKDTVPAKVKAAEPLKNADQLKSAAQAKGAALLKDTVAAKVKAAEPLKNADQLKSAAQAKGAALLKDTVAAKVIDTAKKVLDKIKVKADSAAKQPDSLKKR